MGVSGGLEAGANSVIAGDLKADPFDGDSLAGAAQQLLDDRLIDASCTPSSAGGTDASLCQGGANARHTGDPAQDTADFADRSPDNLRAHYVLPLAEFLIAGCSVFWFEEGEEELFALNGNFPFPASDHRAAYLDLEVPAPVPGGFPLMVGGLVFAGVMLRRRNQARLPGRP
jgi:hypothetical protein